MVGTPGGSGDRVPRCLECRYDLRGVEGDRCPECGWRIDPALIWLGDTERSMKLLELRAHETAEWLQEPAPPSFARAVLAAWALIMAGLVAIAGAGLLLWQCNPVR